MIETRSGENRPRSGLAARLSRVRDRIAAASAAVGRDGDAVRVIAVSKGHPAAVAVEAIEAGLADLGENRVDEGLVKAEAVAAAASDLSLPPPRWHMIGHLQRNKARDALRFADVIQSVDSVALVDALSRRADPDCLPKLMIQVNVTGEPQKYGTSPDRLPELVEEILRRGIEPIGLMCMAPQGATEPEQRRVFAELARLGDDTRERYPELALPELSMGMSDDFEAAVKEGSTMVRIGRLIMGERTY